jgi:hypothetical protein
MARKNVGGEYFFTPAFGCVAYEWTSSPLFMDVWQIKDLQARFPGCVTSKGLAGILWVDGGDVRFPGGLADGGPISHIVV